MIGTKNPVTGLNEGPAATDLDQRRPWASINTSKWTGKGTVTLLSIEPLWQHPAPNQNHQPCVPDRN